MFFFFKAATIVQLYVFLLRILYYNVNKVLIIKDKEDIYGLQTMYEQLLLECWGPGFLRVKHYKNDVGVIYF